jgi:RHS repeat-associated protein
LKTDYVYFDWGEANGQRRLKRILSGTIANSSAGAKLGELRYKAWGEQRYSSGTMNTNRRYTGQIRENLLGGTEGLYFFNARWVDVSLARFAQADSIIPEPGNPQAWDRFAYTSNNPVKYIDPSGHDQDCSTWDWACNQQVQKEKLVSIASNNPLDGVIQEEKAIFHPFGLDADYYSLSIYHGAPGWLIGALILTSGLVEPTPVEEIGAVAIVELLNAGLSIIVDKYGNAYIAPGISIGLNSYEPLPTVTLVAGNLVTGNDKGTPEMKGGSAEDIQLLFSGFSTTHGFSNAFFPSIGTTRSAAAPYNSIEFGIGLPGHINFSVFSFGFGPYSVR